MEWSLFQEHGQAPADAFEAFVGQLFERWCQREHGARLASLNFVSGAGGDGGVEAYATLADGAVIGLQAKWFRDSLGENQFSQIRKSIEAALGVRPKITRYCVAIPRNLSDDRQGEKGSKEGAAPSKGGKASPKKPATKPAAKRKEELTQRKRWENLKADVATRWPNLVLDLWDDARLEALLADLGSDGMARYWFARSTIEFDALSSNFERAAQSWLRQVYLPNLHALGQIEEDLERRFGTPGARARWVTTMEGCLETLERVSDTLNRLPRYEFLAADVSWSPIAGDVAEAVRVARTQAGYLIERYRTGAHAETRYSTPGVTAFDRLATVFEPLENALENGFVARDILTILNAGKDACVEVSRCAAREEGRWRPVLYSGPPGSGKTHALSDAVRSRLKLRAPALLIRGRESDPGRGWAEILRRALDLPTWELKEILSALEASATRADVERARETRGRGAIPSELTRVLIAVDALDESPDPTTWVELMGELEPLLKGRPRILVAMSVRDQLARGLPIGDLKDHVDVVDLPRDGNVSASALFEPYCRAYKIDASATPLVRWALRSPLAVRLFAEEFKGTTVAPTDPADLGIARLLRRKVDRLEGEFRQREGNAWGSAVTPVLWGLRALARASIGEGPGLPLSRVEEVIRTSLKPTTLLSTPQIVHMLRASVTYGLMDELPNRAANPMAAIEPWYQPALNVVTDYLIADAAVEALRPSLGRSDLPRLPDALLDRANARLLAFVMLGLQGFDLLEGGWEADRLDMEERERLQLQVLAALPSSEASSKRSWVQQRLTSSMPSCRRVLRELVIPVARAPSHPLGPLLVDATLRHRPVADRDLFWSGPRVLPSSVAAPWAGVGVEAIEAVRLDVDDLAEGPPLLLAWGSTTTDREERRRIQKELATWGSARIDRLTMLLDRCADTNDLQMLEHLLAAALGAACLTGGAQRLLGLVEWVGRYVARGTYPQSHFVRHYLRAIVEYATAVGVPVEASIRAQTWSVRSPPGDLAVLDRAAATGADAHEGFRPVRGDLAWYVVKWAMDPFFGNPRLQAEPQAAAGPYTKVEDDVLAAALVGELGKLSPLVLQGVRDESDARAAREAQRSGLKLRIFAEKEPAREKVRKLIEVIGLRADRAATPGDESNLEVVTVEIEEDVEPAEAVEVVVPGAGDGTRDAVPVRRDEGEGSRSVDPEVRALLDRHAAALGVEALAPHQFVYGFVVAWILAQGWDFTRFEGRPNGDKPGEVVGADIAIIRRYSPATHGARSPTSSFAEKYTWLATHALVSYLADHLPDPAARSLRLPAGAIPHLAWLGETPRNPASDLRAGGAHPMPWSIAIQGLTPAIPLTAPTQGERAMEWVRNAPPPVDLARWILPAPEDLPEWAGAADWLVLRSFVIAREADSQAESLLWVSSLICDEGDIDLLQRDVLRGWCQPVYRWYEHHAAVGQATYCDPMEALWAPWGTEVDGAESYTTLDREGMPHRLRFGAATAELTWEGQGGESSLWLPASALRRSLGIIDLKDGRFTDRHGMVMASVMSSGRLARETRDCLIVRRQETLDRLRSDKQVLVWAIRLLREPVPGIVSLKERRGKITGEIHVDRHWLAFMRSDSVTILEVPLS